MEGYRGCIYKQYTIYWMSCKFKYLLIRTELSTWTSPSNTLNIEHPIQASISTSQSMVRRLAMADHDLIEKDNRENKQKIEKEASQILLLWASDIISLIQEAVEHIQRFVCMQGNRDEEVRSYRFLGRCTDVLNLRSRNNYDNCVHHILLIHVKRGQERPIKCQSRI